MLCLVLAACSVKQTGPYKTGDGAGGVNTGVASVSRVNALQGRWRSRSDAAASIEIKGNRWLWLYNDSLVSTGVLTFVSNCQARVRDAESEFFIVSDEAGSLCYRLTLVSGTLLEFVYLPRGTTLLYERFE